MAESKQHKSMAAPDKPAPPSCTSTSACIANQAASRELPAICKHLPQHARGRGGRAPAHLLVGAMALVEVVNPAAPDLVKDAIAVHLEDGVVERGGVGRVLLQAEHQVARAEGRAHNLRPTIPETMMIWSYGAQRACDQRGGPDAGGAAWGKTSALFSQRLCALGALLHDTPTLSSQKHTDAQTQRLESR